MVRLKASRQLVVRLKAKRQLIVKLRGGVVVTERNQSFTMFAGDTTKIPVEIQEVDLIGASVRWAMMKSVKSEHIISREIAIDAEGTGFTVYLESVDTKDLAGTFYHVAKLVDSAGHESTIMTGSITIDPSGI